jgi:hypothetical protein
MKSTFIFIFLAILGLIILTDIGLAVSLAITIILATKIILKSNENVVLKEWCLLLYSLNYLLSPAISYQLESQNASYAMKITPDVYFSLALPGFLLFALGMLLVPKEIFKPDFSKINKVVGLNERFLFRLTIMGIICVLSSDFFPTEVAFFIYLVSLFRFLGVFALFAFNSGKYRFLVVFVLGFELFHSFKSAMFHDSIMWLIFFVFFYSYLKKPSLTVKIFGSTALIAVILLIQAFKGEYRERVWVDGEATNLQTISDVGLVKANVDGIVGDDNLLGTLNRGNQAWIFASTVDHMDRYEDFQGMGNVNLYLESALLPRLLAPNKITSGNKMIFNRFSGHQINEGTSMGLGVFADGYIAYGQWGVYAFAFFLGLLFSLVFNLVRSWTHISPFYSLLILPIFNYALRPDIEMQTIINHLAKSIVVFGIFVVLTKYRFTINSANFNKI